MSENEQVELTALERNGIVEYDLADAIYAACLFDSLRQDSRFYFMDEEDGGSSMVPLVA